MYENACCQGQASACPALPASGQPAPNPTATYTAANQVTNNFYQYDLSGDVIYDGANWYAYDNEGRQCAVQSGISSATGYLYDADGRRVAKGSITPSTSTPLPSSMCNAATNGFTVTESYVLGQAGEQLTTYTWSGSQSTWARTNVYGDGEFLATYDAVGIGLHFHLTDHLGTRRVQTDPTGTPETDCQSLPYGDSQYCFAAPGSAATGASDDDATPLHFTGKEGDAESGNDYFGARYYASNMGRFMSPDWAAKEEPVPYATFDDPQSLNLYSYVKNNPLSHADKDGHCCDPDSIIITTTTIGGGIIGGPAGGATGAGAGTLVAPGVGTIGGGYEGAVLGAGGGALLGAGLGKAIVSGLNTVFSSEGDKTNTGPKAATAPGVTAGGQATDQYGNKICPSGKPQVDQVDHSGKKGAKDAARNEGKGDPVKHPSPTKGDPHYHPTDANGDKVPNSTHHNYPN